MLDEAGCGKSTICQYATYFWAQEKIWENHKLYLPWANNYSLIDIIERECFQKYNFSDLDKRTLINQFENPSKILWILEGYDEKMIPDYLKSIERELLTQRNLLRTSRPYQTENLKYDTRIRLQDIETYVNKYVALFWTTASECSSSIQAMNLYWKF